MNLHRPTAYAWIWLWQQLRGSEIIKQTGMGAKLIELCKITDEEIFGILLELDSEYVNIKAKERG